MVFFDVTANLNSEMTSFLRFNNYYILSSKSPQSRLNAKFIASELALKRSLNYSAKYLQQLWKKVRKQGGLCTGITQNVVDLLQNYTATTMLANSEFVALLKQANTDSAKMADVIYLNGEV